jgi:outer membrane biosynthesis protein TonB
MNHQSLQITYRWKGQVIAYRLIGRREVVSIGDHKRVTFATPRLPGFPARFILLKPIKQGYLLRLGPGIAGALNMRGQKRTVGDVLVQPAVRRFLRDPGMFRQAELYPGDSATLDLDVAAPESLQLLISFADAPERIARPRFLPDRLLMRTAGATAAALLLLVFVARLISDRLVDTSQVVADAIVRKVTPAVTIPQLPAADKRRIEELAERARKQQEKAAAMSKRARENEGRLGREDAPARPTVMPKGREDILRAKVAKTGILAALGAARAPGSGLGRLLDTNDHADMEQAMNGLAGAHLVAGKGSGGLGATGTGLGGGGVGLGHIQGSGDLDLGNGRGRGRKGPGLSRGKEREVSAGLETGTPNAEGGLTREQVTRVVRAHAAAIKYCYEKELQRQPTLSGKIEVYWVIRPNGSVDRAKIASSTVSSHEVEGCIERQVRNWQFPKSDADTIVQTFPFFFKGGAG